jgi:hypothetical protein
VVQQGDEKRPPPHFEMKVWSFDEFKDAKRRQKEREG